MKSSTFLLVAILIALSLVLGFWLGKVNQPESKKMCIRGTVEHTDFFDPLTGRTSFIGQQIICAENWELSPVYGPNIEKWIEDGVRFDEPTERYGGEDRIEAKP